METISVFWLRNLYPKTSGFFFYPMECSLLLFIPSHLTFVFVLDFKKSVSSSIYCFNFTYAWMKIFSSFFCCNFLFGFVWIGSCAIKCKQRMKTKRLRGKECATYHCYGGIHACRLRSISECAIVDRCMAGWMHWNACCCVRLIRCIVQ